MLRSSSLLLALLLPGFALAETAEETTRWEATLERVARAVVVIRVSVPRAFDTDLPAYERATGFVVDAEHGLILTNRHVVKPGPAVAEAVFLDHEEVPLEAVYRDPVHDFGFFRFDPSEVEFMQTGELPLAPERARVGTDIRVVGNDAGEKLSILAGTLARLDRSAPNYGRGRYNDFNTFYYQAASSTSGGSSGSPVVDVRGRALAMNAGGSRRASSSFYLPLDAVKRALEHIRRGETVPRGTLQAVFGHVPYDELRRLGLSPETEALVRRSAPKDTAMMVVKEIVPGGPADDVLQTGDVLVRVAGELVTSYTPLAFALDASVGEEIELEVERGGESLVLRPRVGDLHAITPSAYLHLGGAVVHPLSYQQARNYAVPVRGLYLASAGYVFARAGVPRGVVITAVDGVPVDTLDDFEGKLAGLPSGGRFAVRYFALEEPRTEVVRVVTADRLWFPMQRCERDEATGRWPCVASTSPEAMTPEPPATTSFPNGGGRPARDLGPSLVMVDFDTPFRLDGVHSSRFQGAGLVVDAEKGLVVVDRETAPIALGDVLLTFGASVQIPGEVVYLHPVHNLAVVAYDPRRLGETPVKSAVLETEPLQPGDDIWLVGLNARLDVVSRETRVSRVYAPRFPLSDPPRFRQTNMGLVGLDDTAPTLGGVLSDGKGRVRAFWGAFSYQNEDAEPESFFAGIEARHIETMIDPIRSGRDVGWRDLGVELTQINLADARNRGLSDEAARVIESDGESRRRVLSVARPRAGTPSAEAFRAGDLLLRVNGAPATTFWSVARASQAERVRVSVLRDGREVELDVATTRLDGRGTTRCLSWAGAMLQDGHPALATQRGIASGSVYVAWLWFGSPANRFGLRATRRIIEVDGVPTPDLDAFLAEVAERPDRGPVRLRTVDLEGKESVLTLKLDLQFWPTTEFRRNGDHWERLEHGAPVASAASGS